MNMLSQPKAVIYVAWCICHPEDGVRYVGQTSKGVNSRWSVHLWNARTEGSTSYKGFMSSWIRKHGAENIVFSVLEVCTPEELDEREIFWIAFYRDQGANLTNILAGGAQPRGHKRPDHARDMSGPNNPMYGKDRKELMTYARSFQGPPSEETRAKMSAASRGRKHRPETLDKMSVKGRESWTRERKERFSRRYSEGGVTHNSAKLTRDDVREIRRLHAEDGLNYKDIAAIYGVTGGCISGICRRKTWKYVD